MLIPLSAMSALDVPKYIKTKSACAHTHSRLHGAPKDMKHILQFLELFSCVHVHL